ncbi:acyl carrier protein [Chitinimonas arctica]|uniref:Acyl carrier protein n=1 Tax=Chitinimonas arctica TaxID=2594795 RepID=A0A516SI29_9NEIS|nr:acyl carrier protein [Chitinimonas arctica]QDQ27800.1 acyl carrier protein [Chitinimonas arctica]
MTKQEIFDHLSALLSESFAVDPALIQPAARLYEDLDIDSIDAVDLIGKLKPMLGRRLQADAFKSAHTLADVVDALHALMNETAGP